MRTTTIDLTSLQLRATPDLRTAGLFNHLAMPFSEAVEVPARTI
jgi:hypothetical protein